MSARQNGVSKSHRSTNSRGEGPNWILIAGGALLSTLSIRLGYKLKQALDSKQQGNSTSGLKGHGMSNRMRSSGGNLRPNMYSYVQDQDDDGCFNCNPGNQGVVEMKLPSNGQMLSKSDSALPLATAPEFNSENGVMWSSSPDRLELPPKRFHHSTCSDSPCVSESGSDIFTKREVIQKLRQQLKRRDDMILEMQDQIVDLQNSVKAETAHSSHLQAQLDATNRDLFDSEREIQRLRKVIADHCVGHVENPSPVASWASDPRNGHGNGFIDRENSYESPEKGEKIEILKSEVVELKELIEGKEFLLRNYKEQNTELTLKIKELQQRLDSQLPNIL